jgi:hypothetical protein
LSNADRDRIPPVVAGKSRSASAIGPGGSVSTWRRSTRITVAGSGISWSSPVFVWSTISWRRGFERRRRTTPSLQSSKQVTTARVSAAGGV